MSNGNGSSVPPDPKQLARDAAKHMLDKAYDAYQADNERFWKVFNYMTIANAGLLVAASRAEPEYLILGVAALGILLGLLWTGIQMRFGAWCGWWDAKLSAVETTYYSFFPTENELPEVFQEHRKPPPEARVRGLPTRIGAALLPLALTVMWAGFLLHYASWLKTDFAVFWARASLFWNDLVLSLVLSIIVIRMGAGVSKWFCATKCGVLLTTECEVLLAHFAGRRRARDLVKAMRLILSVKGTPYASWRGNSDKENAANLVVSTLDLVALAVKYNLVDGRVIERKWGESIRTVHDVTREFIVATRRSTGDETYCAHYVGFVQRIESNTSKSDD